MCLILAYIKYRPPQVLTAAHCVDMIRSNQLSNIRVEVGAINLYAAANQYEQTLNVAEVGYLVMYFMF